jgi:transposase-like protein
MEASNDLGVELEIREHSDADFFPERCPICQNRDIFRHTYRFREIQDLGAPHLCRRIRYERVFFKCKKCEKTFTIEHPLVGKNSQYMPDVIEYAASRILDRGDSIRRVTRDLNELHHVEVSVGTVEKWINRRGEKGKLSEEFPQGYPPPTFLALYRLTGRLNL